MIAFALFYRENSNTYRIDMLIISKFQIIISPDDGTRKMLHSSFGILDVNWYLLKILTPLFNVNLRIESFLFNQY